MIWGSTCSTLATSSTACDEQRVMVGLANGKLASFELYDPIGQDGRRSHEPRPWWNWQTRAGR